MENVFDVAKWFLSKQSMTHKKLQKMCYYAQAWHLALYNAPLFAEEIQAWVHGPVVPVLYTVYADYKWMDIPSCEFDAKHIKESAISIMDAVYSTYGGFSGDQLESLTHTEMPWINARGELKPWETCSNPILQEDMKTYYWQKYVEAQND